VVQGGRPGVAWLHTWAGLVVGWLLYAIFLTGTISFYRQEISQWMRPELPLSASIDSAASADLAIQRLQTSGAGAERWRIELATNRIPQIETYMWRKEGPAPHFMHEMLDPSTGHVSPARATLGGDLLYYFHFDLQMPSIWGRLIVGFAAITMLVTLISGIVTHRRFFRDFFAFRPRSAPRRAWLDAHNAFGVLVLPFHFVITYTGLITLMFLYMPWGIKAAYPTRPDTFYAEAHMNMALPPVIGAAPLTAIAPLIKQAQSQWGGGSVGVIEIYRPGDANALIELTRNDSETLSFQHDRLQFEGASGKPVSKIAPSAAEATRMVFYGLHISRFANPYLRPFLFACGLAATGMIATGLLLWSVRRQTASRRFGHGLVDRLNTGTIVGLPIAIACYFCANRLLPAGLHTRLVTETMLFFLAWLAAFIFACLCPRRIAWPAMLWIAAFAFMMVPILNALTTNHGLIRSLAQEDGVFAGFDLAMIFIGLTFAAIALKPHRKRAPNAPPASAEQSEFAA
jgi:uncharacterized iron-regulated membrane protein